MSLSALNAEMPSNASELWHSVLASSKAVKGTHFKQLRPALCMVLGEPPKGALHQAVPSKPPW